MSLNKDDIVKSVREQEKSNIQQSVYASSLGDQYKPEVYELATKLKMPASMVSRNYDKLVQQATPIDYDDLTQKSPTLAKWLEDSENAKLAAKDIEHLSYIERQMKFIGSQYEQGNLNVELSDIGAEAVNEALGIGSVAPEMRARQKELSAQVKNNNFGITGFVEQIPGAVAGQIPIMGRTMRDRLAATGVGAAAGATTGAAIALAGGQMGPQVATPEELVTVPVAAAGGATVGARIGWKYGSAVAAGRMEMNLAYLDYEGLKDETGKPVDKNIALGASALVGTINGVAEMVGLERLIGKLPGIRKFTREGIKDALTKPTTGAAIRRYAGTISSIMAAEGGTEAFQAITKKAGELVLNKEYASAEDFLSDLFSDENFGQYLQEARVGAQSGGGMTAVLTAPQLALDVREVKKAEAREKAFLQLGDAVKQSSTVKNTPQTASTLVEGMSDGEVYIDKKQWDTYWQAKEIDPAQMAREVLGDSTEYDSLSDQIRIPIGRYATKIAPTEHNEFFASEIKLEPEGMSARQAIELEQEMDQVTPEQEDAVKPIIVERLMSAGYTKETAEDYASQNSAFIHTMAERAGTTPEAIMDKYGFDIARESVPAEITDSAGETVVQDRRIAPIEVTESAPGDRRLSQAGRGERRKDPKREVFDSLTPEQQAVLLKSDVIPALPGKRAFERHIESTPTDRVMFFDFDDFKAINDKLGEEETDRAILEVAGELIESEAKKAGIVAYHRSGDEFLATGATDEQLDTFAKNLRETLKNYDFIAILPDGSEQTFKGVGFSYGLGQDQETARSLSKQQKAERKRTGERTGARDAPGVVEDPPAGDEIPPSGTTLSQSKAPADAGVSVSTFQKVTDTKAFRDWFGDSKAVDENGEPLVVYHGTQKDFTAFDPATVGAGGATPVDRGFFFDAEYDRAQQYGKYNVIEAYLSIQNPLNVKVKGDTHGAFDSIAAETIEQAESEGHDGIIVTNEKGQKMFVAMRPPQIKSAVGNRGTFDPNDPNILYQRTYNPDKLTDAESKFFLSMNDADWADLKDYAPSAKFEDGKFSVEPADISGLGDWIADLKISRVNEKGKERLPTSFYNDDFTFRFDPQSPKALFQEERGQIQISPDRRLKISLLQNADLTTYIHESGHAYLEILRDMVKEISGKKDLTDTQKGIQKDADILSRWLGIESLDKIERKHHEQFARGYESYTFEGQAPSIGLRRAFAHFRSWMLAVYKKLKNLDVKLNDDVRGVFDRMLATDEQIQDAKNEAELTPIFSDKPEDMTDEVFNAYRSALEKSNITSREYLEQKLLKEMMRERKSWWKEESEKVSKQVEEELNQQKNYIALSILQTGKYPDGTEVEGNLKLDRDSIGRSGFDKKQMKRLNGMDVYRVDGGMDIDLAAQLFRYPSGPELVNDLLNTPKKSVAVARETKRRMLDEYGDIFGDASQLADQAKQAVLDEGRSEVVHQEMKTLNEILKKVSPFLKDEQRRSREGMQLLRSVPKLATLKFWASNEINQIKIKDLRPQKYWTTMRAASREALKAVNQKDYNKAFDQKQKELLNLELYRQATQAIEESETIVKFLKKFQKPTVRERLGKVNRLEQVDALLDFYDLHRISNKQIDSNKARFNLLKAIEDGEISASREFSKSLAGSDKKNYRDETIEVLKGLRDILRQIDKESLNELEVMVGEEKMVLSKKAMELADSVMLTGKSVMPAYGQMSPEEKLGKTFKNLVNSWFRPATLARLLDGTDFGAWTKNIIEPIRKAVIERLEPMLAKAQEDLANLYKSHYSTKEMMLMNERSFVQGINVSISRWDLISLALNWGNVENRKSILEGKFAGSKSFTESGVLQALGTLDKRDWDFVQDTWDYIDSYWPQIVDAQKRRRGVAPPKVEADAFSMKTRDGQMIELKGGYYPLKYNNEIDPKAQQKEMDSLFDGMKLSKSAQTKYAHNQERIGSGGQPVLLSMNVLHNHINHVIRDIALGDAVIYVDKVLKRTETKTAMAETGNLDGLKTFQLWLKDTAVGEMGTRSGAESVARFVRLGFTKSKIGFNVVTTVLQLAGLPQTMVVVGKKSFYQGTQDYLKNPKQAIQQVMAQSKFMHARYQLNAFNKDIQGVQEALKSGSPSTTAKSVFLRTFLSVAKNLQLPAVAVNWAFLGIRYTQMQVDTITWLAGYNKAKDMNLNAEDSIKYADSQVDKAQGSGIFSDRSSIERGTLNEEVRQTEFVKLWTTLMSYMIAKGNIAVERGKETDFKKLNEVFSFGTDMMLLFSAEIILVAAIKGDYPDEDDSWLWWLTKRTGEQMISTIPVLREIPSFTKGFGASGGPLGAFMKDIGSAITQTSQGEFDKAFLKSYINILGTLTGAPSVQINRFVDAYWRETEGEDVPAIEYLTGSRN